jgi:hypothetical protein
LIESQNIEWKLNWHDDYLKWVCGFANAFGGKVFIGKLSINNVSRNTATSELRFLVNEKVFKASKIKGAGSFYEIL